MTVPLNLAPFSYFRCIQTTVVYLTKGLWRCQQILVVWNLDVHFHSEKQTDA